MDTVKGIAFGLCCKLTYSLFVGSIRAFSFGCEETFASSFSAHLATCDEVILFEFPFLGAGGMVG